MIANSRPLSIPYWLQVVAPSNVPRNGRHANTDATTQKVRATEDYALRSRPARIDERVPRLDLLSERLSPLMALGWPTEKMAGQIVMLPMKEVRSGFSQYPNLAFSVLLE